MNTLLKFYTIFFKEEFEYTEESNESNEITVLEANEAHLNENNEKQDDALKVCMKYVVDNIRKYETLLTYIPNLTCEYL